MLSAQGIFRVLRVIEVRVRPSRSRVANRAVRGPAQSYVIRILRCLEQCDMTSRAGGRQACVVSADVTTRAGHAAVGAGQGERSLAVVETRRLPA